LNSIVGTYIFNMGTSMFKGPRIIFNESRIIFNLLEWRGGCQHLARSGLRGPDYINEPRIIYNMGSTYIQYGNHYIQSGDHYIKCIEDYIQRAWDYIQYVEIYIFHMGCHKYSICGPYIIKMGTIIFNGQRSISNEPRIIFNMVASIYNKGRHIYSIWRLYIFNM
jgi:hypothetical protein